MAKLQPGLQFTGSIGNISAYKLKDTGKIIIRTKGGPTKEQVKKGKNFERTRENNMEMGGRSRAAKWIRHAMGSVSEVTNLHISNALQPVITTVQKADTESARGQRNIYFSREPQLLPGFSLNTRFGFEQLITSPLKYEIDAAAFSARVQIPELRPGVNLFLPDYAPLLSLVISLGLVPDVVYTARGYAPGDFSQRLPAEVSTPWLISSARYAAQEVAVALPSASQISGTLMLCAGIRLGKPGENGSVFQHKYAGAGKILDAVAAGI